MSQQVQIMACWLQAISRTNVDLPQKIHYEIDLKAVWNKILKLINISENDIFIA